MLVEVAPMSHSRIKNPILKVPIRVSWEPLEEASPRTISRLIKEAWAASFGDGQHLDDRQLLKLSQSQLVVLLYRSKHYNRGVLKVSYMAESREDAVNLYFDLPPITPGELQCRFVHEDLLRLKFTKIQAEYQERLEYLQEVHSPSMDSDFPVLAEKDSIATLEMAIKIAKQQLGMLYETLAEIHVALAFKLHELKLKGGPAVDQETLASMKVLLPLIPNSILSIANFKGIKAFVEAHGSN